MSNMGRIKTLERTSIRKNGRTLFIKERILKCYVQNTGYCVCSLSNDEEKKIKQVHRIVAETFVPNPEKKPQVNHINRNKSR